MNVVIRTDASINIGSGHVRRCLVLAEDLRQKNVNVIFVCRPLSGDLIDFIKNQSFPVISLTPFISTDSERSNEMNYEYWLTVNWRIDVLETMQAVQFLSSINWLIIDHYNIDYQWEQAIKPFVEKIMVIDDLANRAHDCDLLLDHNLVKEADKRYVKLVPEHTKLLLGTKYLLLRQEFRDFNEQINRTGFIKRIMISFGGSDPTNETLKAIYAVHMLHDNDIIADVVIGASTRSYSLIKQMCQAHSNLIFHYNIQNISRLMAEADLAVGAGGSSTWERCFFGLPTITIETANNQSEILQYLAELGAVHHLGVSKKVTVETIAQALQWLISSRHEVKKMGTRACSTMKNYQHGLVAEQLCKGE
ncbi:MULTISPECIES: UDP-2,4-diacetamido-2,4,6-trideoxy-beta-L-altropyranose hydrolase [Clostridia]|uniref:UDP-2,4-diacetamido-2,4, 6-trideoxy-beta-L-altropyranose hydrolase n=1 Tax=Clostridia TaxID=186801 RepID=UPI00131437DA|nr:MULTISPECIES: UDP-2,4-diacetamido-2,4,6-trideoxy-beta-L-altropyranose hydrolase [Clostridia]